MKKLFLVFLAFLLLVSPCFAYSVPDDTIVYVTNTGTKYHRENCSYLSSKRSMTISRAEAAGYTPCSRCDPDVLLGEYGSNWDGERGGSSGHSYSRPTARPTPTPEPTIIPDNKETESAAQIAFILFVLFFALPLAASIIGAVWMAVLDARDRIRESRKRKKELDERKFNGPTLFELIKSENEREQK